MANEDALEEVLAPLVAKRGNDELARALQARGVPAARVLSSAEILADEQLRARGFWRTLLHPVLGEFTAPAAPFVADRTRTGPERAAPLLGEHTRELASSLLALDEDEIDALVEEKVLW
jgi:benzylsuccinate CoA-transferase BbsF subunit/naphthyl-2-methylsuccinate CoA transferase subunit